VTPNPYSAPEASPTPSGPPRRLFTAAAVAVHVFLVPPIGAMLALTNYRRLHDPRGMWKAVAFFVVPAVALIGFGIASRSAGQIALVQAARVGLAVVAFRDQKPLVSAHFAAGGRKGRVALGWLVALPLVVLAVWNLMAGAAPDPAMKP